MKIVNEKIVLRDMMLSDIEDSIRWRTTKVLWKQWDEPWEYDDETEDFNEEEYRKFALQEFDVLEKIRKNNELRQSLEIDTIDGVHIGTIDIYYIDKEYRNISSEELNKVDEYYYAIGIAIYEDSYWNKGLGSMALKAYVNYLKSNISSPLFLQTWSGNKRMLKVAYKLGFEECCRKEKSVKVRGSYFDIVTLKL